MITIDFTGLGTVSDPPATGTAASSTILSRTATNPIVTISGVTAEVLFSGLAPGAVGEYQVNVQVPSEVRSGSAVPVAISIGGITSNVVVMAVQ